MQTATQPTGVVTATPPDSAAQNGKQAPRHNYDLKCNGHDELDRKIKEIYAREPGRYIVYVTDDDMLHTLAEGKELELLNERVDINEERARIRDYKENAESLGPKYQNSYAKAMVAIMENRSNVGLVLLRRIRENMARFLKRESVFVYLLGAATATIAILLPYLIFYSLTTRFKNYSYSEAGVFYAIAFSCIGGFLSVATGTGKMRVDLLDSRRVKFVYGIFRVAIAVFSGVLVFYLLGAGVLSGVFEDANFKSVYGIFIVCAAAGFLEKLVPNAMLKVTGEKVAEETLDAKVDATEQSVYDLKTEVEDLKNAQTKETSDKDDGTSAKRRSGDVGLFTVVEGSEPTIKGEPDLRADAARGTK